MASSKRKANRRNTAILFDAISHLIDNARERATMVINIELVVLYWQIGKCINDTICQYKRAGNADAALGIISERLREKYGKSWTTIQLKHFSHCATVFSERQILDVLKAPLSWTHIRILSNIEDPLQLKFYLGICIQKKWTAWQLQQSINNRLFEQSLDSKKPEDPIKKELELLNKQELDVKNCLYKDPSFLDFLGWQEAYVEKDPNESVIVELQKLLMNHDHDLAFLSRRKMIMSGDKEYYIDLLFYHRRLSRLLMVNLDMGSSNDSQSRMDASLHWLDKNEHCEGEQPPIGLALCSDNVNKQMDIWTLRGESIKSIPYPAELLPEEIIRQHIKEAVLLAKEKQAYNTSLTFKHETSAEELFVGSAASMFTSMEE